MFIKISTAGLGRAPGLLFSSARSSASKRTPMKINRWRQHDGRSITATCFPAPQPARPPTAWPTINSPKKGPAPEEKGKEIRSPEHVFGLSFRCKINMLFSIPPTRNQLSQLFNCADSERSDWYTSRCLHLISRKIPALKC